VQVAQLVIQNRCSVTVVASMAGPWFQDWPVVTADGALELPLPVPLLDELAEPEESSEEVLESSALDVAVESSEPVERPDEDVELELPDDEPGSDDDATPAVAWVPPEADVGAPIDPS
jgi:hypothetical protein